MEKPSDANYNSMPMSTSDFSGGNSNIDLASVGAAQNASTPKPSIDEELFKRQDYLLTPPPPASYFKKAVIEYVCRSPQFLIEILVCVTVAVLGKVIPSLVTLWFSWENRPIPYQVTKNGDVILDLELSYQYNESQTVPGWALTAFCIVLPIVLLFITGFVFGPKRDAHAILCVYLVAFGTSEFLTGMLKLYVGRPRPNFYGMCGFNENTLACETEESGRMSSAWKSFPSGHSSLAFASMTVVSLYFLGKTELRSDIWSGPYGPDLRLPSTISSGVFPSRKKKILTAIALLPMLVAIFVAASRVHDFFHHPADVVAGSIIGFSCASFAYGMWYPSIYSHLSGFPLQTWYQMAVDKSLNGNLSAQSDIV